MILSTGVVSYLCICLISLFAVTVNSLECYSCKDQDGNKDKCIKTSKQCEQSQDVCYSSITWRIPPYWTPRGNRIHYLSKDCDTQKKCQAKQEQLKHICIRDWYLDWQCHECCQGDLCNYYVTVSNVTM
ncbi:hypothetical protein HELRODRAFT_164707 [Helobdella robusta]|uniref:UPAR/Ly6 domain-containing protein n=1 Tax=Helobdella robusta TaxID=6412 RepID=T1EVR2_HELRO|nr:hypothetical protein HELRODRAFT_164707 [Helobdella robusta]ESN92631.1 hypothetical protein HELRODRAFT_164707 [Helobdella robusta]